MATDRSPTRSEPSVAGWDLRPLLVLAWATFLGNVRSLRGAGLFLIGALPTVLVAGLALDGIRGTNLASTYIGLELAFLPLILLIVALLVAVPLFRDEIDSQSISYLVTRTIGKPRILLGKYLGGLGAASTFLLPSSLVAYGIAAAASSGSTVTLNGVLPSVVAILVLGELAYSAFFLFLGLVFRRALIWGLLYAFFWEEFVGDLPGSAPELCLRYYLLAIPGYWVPSLSSSISSSSPTLGEAFAAPLGFAVVVLLLVALVFQFLPLVPGPE